MSVSESFASLARHLHLTKPSYSRGGYALQAEHALSVV